MRVILLSFVSLFLLQCSVAEPDISWLENAQGTWYLTSSGNEFLTDTVGISGTSTGGKIVISSSGSFTAGSTDFTFIEIDSTGIFAIYSFTISESTKYIALGFNSDYDILYNASVSTTTDITATTTGNILMKR